MLPVPGGLATYDPSLVHCVLVLAPLQQLPVRPSRLDK